MELESDSANGYFVNGQKPEIEFLCSFTAEIIDFLYWDVLVRVFWIKIKLLFCHVMVKWDTGESGSNTEIKCAANFFSYKVWTTQTTWNLIFWRLMQKQKATGAIYKFIRHGNLNSGWQQHLFQPLPWSPIGHLLWYSLRLQLHLHQTMFQCFWLLE